MGGFFAELKRRHVYRVGAAYAVVAWVLLQLFNNVAPILESPPWVARVLLLLLVLGFPIALLLAWTFEATLAGIKRETPAVAGASPPLRHSWIDWVLACALIVVIALVSYEQLTPSRPAASRQAGVDAARAAANSPATAISIAVLPFANLSDDRQQEFFSDGMTEEISGALAKIPDLSVVARTSAFQFKGQNPDIAAISKALNATHLIEGTVRKAGDRVRITVQLVRASNGLQMWSENYDRNLTDIFAVQEEIARAVATSLGMQLGLAPGERLVSNRTNDLDSYQQYLRARTLIRARAMDEAVAALEEVVARDPDYAPAWALLPTAYNLAFAYNAVSVGSGSIEEQRRSERNLVDKMEKAAREAIRLDPKQPGGYSGLARVEARRSIPVAAESLYRQALALDPGDPETLDDYSQWLLSVGRVKDSLRLRAQLRLLEPFVPIYSVTTVAILHADGQSEAAIGMLEATPSSGGGVGWARNLGLARAYAATGRYRQAADTLLAIPQDQNRTSRQSVVEAARLLRTAPAKVSAPDALPELHELSFVYLYVGAPDRVMDDYERDLEIGGVTGFRDWDPEFAPVRKTERFKAFARRAGLVDYWKTRGWPDVCRPMGADDFVCD